MAIRLTVNDFLFSVPSVRFDLWKAINILRGNLCKKGCSTSTPIYLFRIKSFKMKKGLSRQIDFY